MMKNKFSFQYFFAITLMVVMSIISVSCKRDGISVVNETGVLVVDKDGDESAPKNDPTIVKGHDNWAKVEVIIRMGHLHGVKFHGNPEQLNRPIIPITQKVVFEQTPQGVKRTIHKGNSLKKDDEAIEVIASPDGGARYSMEIIYYNSSNERINYQFLTPEQLHIHQHFFTVNKYVNFQTGQTYNANRNGYFTNLYSYVYRDTTPDDKMIDAGATLLNEPVGLKGYFHFKKESTFTRFNMVVRLNHFKAPGYKGSEANNPSRIARLQSVTDFFQKIPFVVIAYDGIKSEETDQYLKDVAKYYDITEEKVEEYILDSDVDPESSQFWM